jgi:flagellar biosynthesis protein FlhF
MRIKKFTGATLKDATSVMKEELGDEAIVLNTRRVHKGSVLNFLGKEEYEVTAAIDEEALTATAGGKFAGELARAGAERAHVPAHTDTVVALQNIADKFGNRTKEKTAAGATASLGEIAGYQELRSEVESLKSLMHEVALHFKYSKMPSLPELLKDAYATLVEHDVDERLAAELVQRVSRTLGEDLLDDKKEVEQCLLKEIASCFTPIPHEQTAKKAKVIALVGPTGVGKTTTIAKLAAIHKLIHKQNVALISADTYRIGAIEQLRTFAAIADIAMEVVYKPGEMKAALAKFSGRDVVFVDTVGRSPRVKKEISELAKFAGAANPHEVHLVLSATTSRRALDEIIESFRVASPNRVIISKADEAATFGQVLNIAHTSRLPIAYLTTGQSVPDDITMANNVQLSKIVYTGELHA